MSSLGKLRQRITLQQEVRTADLGGGASLLWQDVAMVWAEIEVLRGFENVQAQALQSQVNAKIHIRFRSDVHAGMRAVLGNKIYVLEAVYDPDGMRRFLILLARESKIS